MATTTEQEDQEATKKKELHSHSYDKRRRSSIIEAHNIYVKYHQDLSSSGVPKVKVSPVVAESKPTTSDDTTKPDDTTTADPATRSSLYEDAIDSNNDPLAIKPETFPMFHRVEKTGVIYATKRAKSYGFNPTDPTWANMGQGAPETGPLDGAPSRSFNFSSMYNAIIMTNWLVG